MIQAAMQIEWKEEAPIPTIEMAQNKAYTALLGVSTQDFFNFIQCDPSFLAGIPSLTRVAAWGWRVSHHGERRTCRGNRSERVPSVQNDLDCARAALALASDVVPAGLNS